MTEAAWFGRIYKEDSRDLKFNVGEILETNTMPEIPEKFWWAKGWIGNQGATPECVAYSWSHWFEDGPVIQDTIAGRAKPVYNTTELYETFRKYDGIEGNYAGTTVRAGAKTLQKLGIVEEYRWAQTIEEVINTVKYLGPMVVGTNWMEGMNHPTSAQHIIRPTGRSTGGHAYLLNGINMDKELFRIKNSWGSTWGYRGIAYIRFRDFEKLLNDRGEACVAFENKINSVPDLSEV